MEKVLTDVSFWASIATLILFVLYFVGRIWSIQIRKNEIFETVEFLDNEPDEFALGILNCEQKYCECGTEAFAKISFHQSVNFIKVCRTNKFDFDSSTVQADEILFERGFANAGFVFTVRIDLPEGIQNTWIEIERYDYSRARIYLLFSGLKGKMYLIENTKPSIKNKIYYIVR